MRAGVGCSKLQVDNPGLVTNIQFRYDSSKSKFSLISLFYHNLWMDGLKIIEKRVCENAFKQS